MSQESSTPSVSAPEPVPWDRLVLVAGHPRGGTSWLAAMLAQSDDVRYIFEPEHATHPLTPFDDDVAYLYRRMERWFLDGSEEDDELVRVGNSLRSHIGWLSRHYHGEHVPLLLIKTPQTEKLRWIVETLDVERIIYVRRHPLGIVNSYAKDRLYGPWNVDTKIAQAVKAAATLGIDIDFDRAKTWEGKLALLVHLRYTLLDRVLEGTNHLVLDYEDLCFDTASKMRGVFKWCEWEWNSGVERRIEEMVNPAKDEAGIIGVHKRSVKRALAWREELAPSQIHGVHKLFEELQITGYVFPGEGLAPLTIQERFAGTLSHLRRRLGRVFSRRAAARFATGKWWSAPLKRFIKPQSGTAVRWQDAVPRSVRE